ncbi:Ig-like domain-containing protein [Microbacterium oxydans]|uniref:Ig-like domain-containing protein n=1 Tax=Microbacterium oxydans TaxID=82380 RepID=UPI00226B551E|nr:hypothetical protein [Microbacterium oxydans]WAA65607.1 hypothetical protein MME74_15435 [Microbacterium oxydans]
MPIGPNGQAGAIAIAPGAKEHAALIPSFGVELWVTDDSGVTWRQLPDVPGVRNAGDTNRVVIDPADGSHWWYAGTAIASAESVLLETVDGGQTWSEAARFPGELLTFLVTGPESALVVATSTGATTTTVHTRNGSDAWSSQSLDTGARVLKVISHGDALILRGAFAAWRLDSPGSGSDAVEIYRVSDASRRAVEEQQTNARTSDEDVNQIWDMASTESVVLVKELGGKIVGSTDAGTTWTDWGVPHDVSAISSNGDALYLVRSGPPPRWVDITTDAGASFTPLRIPDDGAIEHQFTTWADGSLTSANPRSGLYRTTDNGHRWDRTGVQGTSGLDLLAHGNRLFAGTEYGLASTTIPAVSPEWGTTGGEARVGTTTAELADAGDDQLVWKAVNATFNELDVHSSADDGKTWNKRTNVYGVARELLVHPADPDTVILTWQLASRCGVHVTHDGGNTWTTSLSECFDAVIGDPNDPDRVWFGGPAGLFRSDDGGATGEQVSDIPTSTILLDKHQIIIGGDKLHTSDDDGATFTQSTRPAPTSSSANTNFTSLVRSGPRLFVGFTTGANTANTGVLVSSDGGSTWAGFSTGLQNSEVLSLAISPDGNTLFAGTRNGGVHSTPLPPRIAPSATADTAHTVFGEMVSINVLDNDSGGDLRIDPETVALQSPEDGTWNMSLKLPRVGAFTVDPTDGTVAFVPDASFSGTTRPVTYRFTNTDGETAHAELKVVVAAPTAPDDGSGSGSGSGSNSGNGVNPPGGSKPGVGYLANTGTDPMPIIAAAVALLAAGTTLAVRARRRRRAPHHHAGIDL